VSGVSVMNPEVHTLTGAHVCDALDPVERAAFEEHLTACAACTQEIAELRETAAALAMAVALEPPARLRAALAARIATIRQLPPTVTSIGAARSLRRRGRAAVTGWAVAAALAGVVAGLTVQTVQQRERIDAVTAQASAMSLLLSAPDARSGAARVSTGGTALVIDSRSRDEAAIALSGLAALPAGKAYQLWMIGPDGIRSGGLVPRGGNGSAAPILEHGLGDARTIGLTVEPAHGSAQPTSAPILLLSLGA
jgi:hypothetical protein